MRNKYPFLSGTILLTLTGFLTKIIGFFYRIFLSRSIGEEGMGIYQLLAPIMALSYAFTSAGIQTAISKYTAAYHAQGRKRSALATLLTGFLLSILFSVIATVFLYQNAAMLAARFLLEPRCEPLIRIFALSIPFASIHSCINGYYYGLKKTLLPSASLLAEQLARVLSVYAIYTYGYTIHTHPTIAVAMLGVLIGEVCSTLLSTIVLFVQEKQAFHLPASFSARAGGRYTKEIILLALPLMANRLVLNGLQSIEAVYIPNRLTLYGLSTADSLRCYGVLTGMVLPLLLFPSAITSSVSVLLLPYISEAQAVGNHKKIRQAVKKCLLACLLLGSICCLFLLFFGTFLGKLLFNSTLAGDYIRMLSIVCPILYMGSVLNSILHGLGRALSAFLYNVVSLLLRLAFVFFLIPSIGMYGYLLGIFFSQLLFTALILFSLRRYFLAR